MLSLARPAMTATLNAASVKHPAMALLATVGGARGLHREHEIGSLEPGKAADLLVLDGRRSAFAPYPGQLSNIVYAATPAEVEHVFVAGEAVVVQVAVGIYEHDAAE